MVHAILRVVIHFVDKTCSWKNGRKQWEYHGSIQGSRGDIEVGIVDSCKDVALVHQFVQGIAKWEQLRT